MLHPTCTQRKIDGEALLVTALRTLLGCKTNADLAPSIWSHLLPNRPPFEYDGDVEAWGNRAAQLLRLLGRYK